MRFRTHGLLALGFALAVADAARGASFVRRRVRQRAGEPEGRGDEDRVAEPARLLLHRRAGRADRESDELGPRNGRPGRHPAERLDAQHDEDRRHRASSTGTKAKNGKPLANARSVIMASTGKKLGAGSSEGVTP